MIQKGLVRYLKIRMGVIVMTKCLMGCEYICDKLCCKECEKQDCDIRCDIAKEEDCKLEVSDNEQ